MGSPRPHLHQDWAHPAHICTGTRPAWHDSPRHVGLAASWRKGAQGYSRVLKGSEGYCRVLEGSEGYCRVLEGSEGQSGRNRICNVGGDERLDAVVHRVGFALVAAEAHSAELRVDLQDSQDAQHATRGMTRRCDYAMRIHPHGRRRVLPLGSMPVQALLPSPLSAGGPRRRGRVYQTLKRVRACGHACVCVFMRACVLDCTCTHVLHAHAYVRARARDLVRVRKCGARVSAYHAGRDESHTHRRVHQVLACTPAAFQCCGEPSIGKGLWGMFDEMQQ